MRKKTLLDFDLQDLKKAIAQCGFPEYRGKQVWDWLYKGAEHIGDMKNLPAPIISRLEEDFTTGMPRIVKKQVSALDGTAKYLVRYHDGSMVECVYLVYRFGRTVCVSSQVGCRMGCSFCASTKGGLVRSLSSGEIIGQVLAVQKDVGERITNVVVMGSGEPMDNFENVVAFIRLLGCL